MHFLLVGEVKGLYPFLGCEISGEFDIIGEF